MTRKMMQFTRLEQRYPAKRKADERRGDFKEIYGGFDDDAAGDQASRCEQCGVPFCHLACPLNNNIPDWLMPTAKGRIEEAYATSAATNDMPEITGRICPQDRLCEGDCVLEQSDNDAVTIGAVEKYLTDTAWKNGWIAPIKPLRERKESVGVIGAGPGGMAAAYQLRARGYQVHVYDRYDRVGGLLVYGIPGFKLEKEVVARREKHLKDSGVTFHLNTDVGKDVTFAELRAKHAAILIAVGVYAARPLSVPGAGVKGVHQALAYLTASNRADLGDDVPELKDGTLNAKGKNVVVIGGGDTAMDCVRTALRQGAKSVKCVYRRDRANMPGSQREVANATEEGAAFEWLAAPEAVLDDGKGAAKAVRTVRIALGLPDASGRRRPEPVDGSQFDIPADMVITALGFEPEDLPALFGEPELKVSRWGTVDCDEKTKMTSLPGVFAAGDAARGASLVVWAIRDGRDAAQGIDDYIQAHAARAKAS